MTDTYMTGTVIGMSDLKKTRAGSSVFDFKISVPRESSPEADEFYVECRSNKADWAYPRMKRGDEVCAIGSLELHETPDGEGEYPVIRAEELVFVDKR